MNKIVDLAKFHAQRSMHICPVILSGGLGSRLWPLSRALFPKQLLALTSERSMLQETALRGGADSIFSAPIVVCSADYRFLIERQLRDVKVKPQQIILEPVGRNTAPAIAAAALWLVSQDPDALMLVQPSDHVIGALAEFHAVVARASASAREGRFVTFGIQPTRPETGYGYIQAGTPLGLDPGLANVARFVEKPDLATAERFVESGVFFWNSGIFLMGAQAYLDELGRLHPLMLEACEAAFRNAKQDKTTCHLDKDEFSRAPTLSVDRAVMEHTSRAAVIPIGSTWSDVGSWRALHEISPADSQGNVVHGDVILEQVDNCYIDAGNRLVAAIGLKDLTIVATEDAILVARNDDAASVGKVVDLLKATNRTEHHHHTTVHRPWGNYRSVDSGDRFQVKHITVEAGGQLSLQKHYHRAEHWVVVQGTALVQRGDQSTLLRENETIHIPIGMEHRLENPGRLPLHLIEVQIGAYLGEDDIVRLADTYGRV